MHKALLTLVFLTLFALVYTQQTKCMNLYTVDNGDTCELIAKNINITVDKLKSINDGLNCDDPLQPGIQICLSTTAQPTIQIYARGEANSAIRLWSGTILVLIGIFALTNM
jgi:spore germination protein YaaH